MADIVQSRFQDLYLCHGNGMDYVCVTFVKSGDQDYLSLYPFPVSYIPIYITILMIVCVWGGGGGERGKGGNSHIHQGTALERKESVAITTLL